MMKNILKKLSALLLAAILCLQAAPIARASNVFDYEPIIGEIRIFAGNFAPVGWALCDGSLLPIAAYPVLFDAIGTTYGGDGSTTFALPDLRGRVPVGIGNGYTLGQSGGSEYETLLPQQMPAHTHGVTGLSLAASAALPGSSAAGNTPLPDEAAIFAQGLRGERVYASGEADAQMSSAALEVTPQDVGLAGTSGTSGNGQAHNNMAPYLGLNYIICVEGQAPSEHAYDGSFLGEIKMFAFETTLNHYPKCDGSIMSISGNDALFSLLGTTYGGNGSTHFALPNLKGRSPLGMDGAYALGQTGGATQVTLTSSQIPSHTHTLATLTKSAAVNALLSYAAGEGNAASPVGSIFARGSRNERLYSTDTADGLMRSGGVALSAAVQSSSVAPAGGGQPHNNMMPYLAVNFVICVTGIYPGGGSWNNDYIAMISMFACANLSSGYADCAGQIVSIPSNTALFSLIGTTYGGNGTVNFALPDIQGRFAIGPGYGPGLTYKALGDRGGAATHTLTLNELPLHSHGVTVSARVSDAIVKAASGVGDSRSPAGAVFAKGAWNERLYSTAAAEETKPVSLTAEVTAAGGSLSTAGGGAAHENMPPYMAIRFAIATQGIYPSRY